MKFFNRFFYCCFTVAILCQACSPKTDTKGIEDEQALVNVNGKILYKHDVDEFIPSGLNPTDSTLAAEAYVKMWIKSELVYEKAKENLIDKEKTEEFVENYRQSLTIFTYQEQLLRERLAKSIAEPELRAYYDNNPDEFALETNVIKGLFLKVPKISPRLEDLKKWYKQGNEKSVENIEKYSLQNAVIYDYFYDKWISFDDVMHNIPYTISDAKQFLKTNKNLEAQDSAHVYLLNIKEYALEGSKAPFEFAKGQILDIILNQKRDDFIRKFEDDLYNKAIKDSQIKFYNK